jgi:heptaprenyl diphosphate synthase
VLAEKTGSLIATSGRLGSLLAGASSSAVDVLTRYGATIGMAFQLSDDLLDVASSTGQSGKTPGTDLREGIRTLPVLYALRADPSLAGLLLGDLGDDAVHAAALAALRGHPAMAEARATLESYAGEAKRIAADLPESPARDALVALADFVVARTG